MDATGITPVMSVGGENGFGAGGFGGIIGLLATLGLVGGFMNGNGLFGGNNNNTTDAILAAALANNNGFANAIGYENLATSNEVQRGFDNQNAMANQREILSAVTSGTAQSVAATNQSFHDMLTVVSDKYNEVTRDIASLAVGQANALANQNQCCCDVKQLIQATASATQAQLAQNNYDAAMRDAATNANITAQIQSVKDMISQNKIEELQQKIGALELQQAVSGVVRYPMTTTYSSGCNPFCGC